ncbi:MAG: hypothetical protein NTV98_04995 [Candidatus Roizmanbacteria bacterium]|nr:hypothetical protein [Candidatus Roizmanbacteria bacterium]
MAEKHLKSKETDITGVLVVALIVMVGFLIVKVTGTFTQTSTSTSSRAAKPALKSTSANKTVVASPKDDWCKSNDPLNGASGRTLDPGYDGSNDKCVGKIYNCGGNAIIGIDTNYAVDETTSYLAMSKSDSNSCSRDTGTRLEVCCRKTANTQVLGDSSCRTSLGNTEAFCTIDKGQTDSSTRTCTSANKTAIPCAKTAPSSATGTNSLYQGVCCNAPLSVSLTDCGRKHISCSKFNSLFKKDDDSLKNTNSKGEKVTAKCMANATSTDAFCVNDNATKDISGYIRCDGSQFADKVYGQYGCFTTTYNAIPSATGSTFYCLYSEVSLSGGQKCKDMIHRY